MQVVIDVLPVRQHQTVFKKHCHPSLRGQNSLTGLDYCPLTIQVSEHAWLNELILSIICLFVRGLLRLSKPAQHYGLLPTEGLHLS